jgi:uncharacterized protein YndB with AHSA1/START domain
VKRWWAHESRGAVVACDADVRAGGGYRYVVRLNRGGEFAFSGTYSEVTPPSRLVYSQFFEPTASGVNPGDAAVMIPVQFNEQNGKTHMTSTSLCPSKDVRDAIIASGMEKGMRATMDLLDELVGSLS